MISKYMIMTGAFVFLFLVQEIKADAPKSGSYDLGDIAVNKIGSIITGYISDGIGDDGYGSPERTCFIYFSGRINQKEILIDLWEFKGNEIFKYKAKILSDSKMIGNYIIQADKVPNAGICSSSTFTKEGSTFITSMMLIKEYDWKTIYLIKNDNSPVYKDNKENSKVIKHLSGKETVKAIFEENGWIKIDLQKEGFGWIKTESVYNLE